jgi:hypothetical protein
MFEYAKTILGKVSFSKSLFEKELKKSLTWLSEEEIFQLKIWVNKTFGNVYSDVIVKVFN